MIEPHSLAWINTFFWVGGGVLVFRALNRMNGITDPAVRYALVLVCAGCLGEAFGTAFTHEWQNSVDTMLAGGLVAAFIGTRRSVRIAGLTEHWRRRLSILASIATLTVFLLGVA